MATPFVVFSDTICRQKRHYLSFRNDTICRFEKKKLEKKIAYWAIYEAKKMDESMEFLLAWSLSCSQYHGAVQRLYADPFFQKPEHHEERKNIHEFFKSKTWPKCLEVTA